jgi:hypothetical protein
MSRDSKLRSFCDGKKAYLTKDEAVGEAITLFKIDTVRRVRVYPCPRCGCFHVTRGTGRGWVWEAKRDDEPPLAEAP